MRKILFVVEAMGGGIVTYIVEMANKLSKNYDIYIAYGVREQTPDNIEDYFNERVHLIKVAAFSREINLKKDFKAMTELKKLEKKIRPDIIHLHSSKAGVLGRLVFSHNAKLFYTPHGYSFLMENISHKKQNFYRLVEKACTLRKCVIIACSPSEYEETLSLTKNSTCVSNGIDMKEINDILKEQTDIEKEKVFTVVTLGRVSNQKNPQLFNRIAQKFPNVKFVWIGKGELENELAAKNIEVTGWLKRKDALKRMAQADAFILPSRYEGLPMALLEAMYLKKPCIVSNVVGNKDVISERNGFLCTTFDDYASAVKRVLNGDYDKEKIRNAYDDILNTYNTDVMTKEYSQIYDRALEGQLKGYVG